MSIRTRPLHLASLAAAAIAVSFSACSSTKTGEPTQITNSKYFLLDAEVTPATVDPMIRFENKRYMHGAITRDERKAREGHYYVFWWSDKVRTPAVVRFEYRQTNSGSQILVQEMPVDSPRRKNKTRFTVLGDDYTNGGRVTAWRVSVLRDGAEVTSDQSYLW